MLEEETVILDRANGQIHYLNTTASYVWKHCGGLSAKAIAERLAQVFQIDSGGAEKDAVALLREMNAMKLLEDCDN
jgi:hypothetical protein